MTWRKFALYVTITVVAIGAGTMWGLSRPGLLVRWPGGHVKLYDASHWPVSVKRGVQIWNNSGADVRFELTAQRGDADIVINDDISRRCKPSARGCATIGYMQPPWSGHYLELLERPADVKDVGQMTPTVAHELGHILGLDHNDRLCSLMNSTAPCRKVTPVLSGGRCAFTRLPTLSREWCTPWSDERTLCGPTEQDLEQVIDLYGGAVNARRTVMCTVSEPQPARADDCVLALTPDVTQPIPSFMVVRDDDWVCGPDTPTWAVQQFALAYYTLVVRRHNEAFRVQRRALDAALERMREIAPKGVQWRNSI